MRGNLFAELKRRNVYAVVVADRTPQEMERYEYDLGIARCAIPYYQDA